MIRNMEATTEMRKELLFIEFMAVSVVAHRQSKQDVNMTLSSQHVIVIGFHSCPITARLSHVTRIVALAVKVFEGFADFRQKFVLRTAMKGTKRDAEDEEFVVVKRCHLLQPVEAGNYDSTNRVAIRMLKPIGGAKDGVVQKVFANFDVGSCVTFHFFFKPL